MMKSVKRYALLMLGLVLIGMLIIGCTKEVRQGTLDLDAGAAEGDEFVYVPEFQTLSMNARLHSNSLLMTRDALYYVQTIDGEKITQLVSRPLTTVEEPTQIPLDLGLNATPYRMISDTDGSFLILLYTADQDPSKSSYSLAKYDQTGQKLSELALPEVSDGTNPESYEKQIALDGEGNFYVANNRTIWLYKQSGSYHGQIEISGNLGSMATGKDGKVYIAYQQSNNAWLAELNFNSKSLEKTFDASWGGNHAALTTGANANLLYYDGSSLFEMDPATEKVSKVLDWVDCNMDGLSVGQVTKLTDGRIAAASIFWEPNMVVELATLKKTLISELPDQETIVLGCLLEIPSLQEQVAAFNRINDKYKVDVVVYAKSGGHNDIVDAVTTINTAIATGHAPDMLFFSSYYINLDSFAEKDVFVDLNEMFASSQALKKEDIVGSVVKAFTYDDKLICLPTKFVIDTLYGKTSVVGEQNSWTIQELKALMDEYPGRNIIKYASRNDMLYAITSFYMDTFIDWENGHCYFDGDEFKELLEFMNYFPAKYDKGYFENIEPLLYKSTTIYSFRDYQTILAGMQDAVNFIGYPTPDGTRGIGIVENSGVYAIPSKSKHKEGAWAFLEYLLMEDNKRNELLPVNKNILEQQITRAKNGIYGNVTDNFKPGPDDEPLPWHKYADWYEGEQFPIYAPTQEEIDGFYALIDSTVGMIPRSNDLFQIINEEVGAYYNGSKTLDQVADLIQNRAQVYVSE
ncbi:MAG: extracellular solute-binding protein, partial [Lachnospiraceae bacterium]|nr:extracellular solute-binding protein [Lachnospiraceae bacterium]